ncbi:FtsX-like permease family protein [Bacteroides sp. GD17]|jgi:ABC-type lipoprotein release transport system permease subunit|nr:FtsX-like permease family protein [uncultured Bacteroides sp.]
MIQHYLKIAFRNLLKYKMQTLISIVGLAIGFTCFALATLWIHYEMTYDNYHEGAEQLYLLYKKSTVNYNGYDTKAPNTLQALRTDFPEVEAVCNIDLWENQEMEVKGNTPLVARALLADSTFMEMFDIKILAGTKDFLYSEDKIAVTEETAKRLFGTTDDVVGKELKAFSNVTICAVIKGLPHSNLTFDFWRGEDNSQRNTIIFRLRKGTDLQNFRQKLDNYNQLLDGKENYIFKELQIMPLSKYHYSDVNKNKSIKFTYLILFSIIGLLVILASLFNYISLFVVRMRMRYREIELRQVCGSTKGNLFLMFAIEYVWMILLAGLLGMTLTELLLPVFRKISGVTGDVYMEMFLYLLGILIVSLFLLLPFVMQHVKQHTTQNLQFRKFSVLFQVGISILFIFITSVMMKQIYFLTHTELGWERKNIAVLRIIKMENSEEDFSCYTAVADKLSQMPCVNDVLDNHAGLLFGQYRGRKIDNWDGKRLDDADISIELFYESGIFTRFYNLKLVAGKMMTPKDANYAVINETAAKMMNMHSPLGKHINIGKKQLEIIGVLKDFHVTAPTVPISPILLIGENGFGFKALGEKSGMIMHSGLFLIKYKEGHWEDLKSQIESMAKEVSILRYQLDKTEDVYKEYLHSESLLLKLLSMVSGVCILISALGIFSFVTLSCEQRRKEIAVRKVNGATIKDILVMFVKEYLLLLIIAAAIAFPIGYVLMKQWLQNYVEQTSMDAWIYLAISVGIAFVIAICIGWRVWQAARQNPAEVIKSE